MGRAMWLAWGGMAGFVGVYGWMWTKSGGRGRKWLEWGLAALVAGLSLASVLTHEPWADELHAWLQARDLSVGELWREMAYEGHFLPWYLILHPFACLGAPVETLGWISWAINAATVAWFARKAPLGGWAKAAVGLSCVFLYVNPVISRCYVLVPAALYGVTMLWGKRDEHPVAFGLWTALLANTHVYMEGAAAAVFLMFAWKNILRRADGKSWRNCGRQWAGLGAMAAGLAMAAAQVLPSLWKSSVELGALSRVIGWKLAAATFFMGCASWPGAVAVVSGGAWLGAEAWRRDKSVFWVYAGSLAYMLAFSVFLYPADVINRSLLWWPVAVGAAWALADGRNNQEQGRGGRRLALIVAMMGLGLARPDMSWNDLRGEYDALPGACRYITAQYGCNAEVWINGGDACVETASAYLVNVMDWRTGERAGIRSLSAEARKQPELPFREAMARLFATRPEEESALVLGSLTGWSGFAEEDLAVASVEYTGTKAVAPCARGIVVFRVWRP